MNGEAYVVGHAGFACVGRCAMAVGLTAPSVENDLEKADMVSSPSTNSAAKKSVSVSVADGTDEESSPSLSQTALTKRAARPRRCRCRPGHAKAA